MGEAKVSGDLTVKKLINYDRSTGFIYIDISCTIGVKVYFFFPSYPTEYVLSPLKTHFSSVVRTTRALKKSVICGTGRQVGIGLNLKKKQQVGQSL